MNWCEKHDHFKRTCPWCEIRELEAEIERLQSEVSRLRLRDSLLDKLIEGLKFYANEDNWRSGFVLGRAQADGGERAQAILDEIGVTME